jgi:glycine hydroxymethyltransferase
VLGLIAGEQFQSPLDEGCDVLVGSTHKSFFGPQGGLIVSNDEDLFDTIDTKVFPGIVDNVHLNRVASLCHAMIELLKFGNEYATQVVRNSQALARSLDEQHVPVKCRSVGYTKSHQVLLDYPENETAGIADLLQECDIIVDSGIRVGTSEVTRRGMKEQEMESIAQILSDVLVRKPPTNDVKSRVHKLVDEFSSSIVFALEN